MYATSLEKQKKGNLYVYKFASGSRTPEQLPATSVTKRIIPSSVWGSLRKSKSKSKPKDGVEKERERLTEKEEEVKGIIMHNNGNATEKGNEKEKERERERERKSVSSVEGILMSLANSKGKVIVEGRKSVSNINSDELKEKGKEFPFPFPFPFPFQEEVKGKNEEARKSISDVENSVAYVGKFVEKARKSTGAKLENDVVSAIALLQVKVLVTDMPGFMQIHAFQCARNTFDSLEKFSARHMAYNLKKGSSTLREDEAHGVLVQLNLLLAHDNNHHPHSTTFTEFDKVYGPAWHCIVGSSFGSFVTHASGCFLYFSMEKLCILLFRTKVQKVLQQ